MCQDVPGTGACRPSPQSVLLSRITFGPGSRVWAWMFSPRAPHYIKTILFFFFNESHWAESFGSVIIGLTLEQFVLQIGRVHCPGLYQPNHSNNRVWYSSTDTTHIPIKCLSVYFGLGCTHPGPKWPGPWSPIQLQTCLISNLPKPNTTHLNWFFFFFPLIFSWELGVGRV